MKECIEHFESPLAKKIKQIVPIEKAGCNRTIVGRKVVLSRKQFKTYTVTVRYIVLPDEKAKIKKAIIESIIRAERKTILSKKHDYV